jgi:N6-adenosine-specific RNA methylase IME4
VKKGTGLAPIAARKSTGLAYYDAASRALAKASTVDEVMQVKNAAERMKLYAKQANDTKLEEDAAEIRVRAIIKLGDTVDAQRRTVGLAKPPGGSKKRPRKNDRVSAKPDLPTLAEAGINKSLADKARKLAKLSLAEREDFVAKTREHVSRGVERNAMKIIDLAEARAEAAKRYEKGGKVDDLRRLVAEGRKYGVFYVDWAWKWTAYSGTSGLHRSPERHYATMALKEMLELVPLIAALAADDCTLFTWVPGTHDLEAHELLRALKVACGFEFVRSDAFVWVKLLRPPSPEEERLYAAGFCTGEENLRMTKGTWSRCEAEKCWLATKGEPTRLNMDVREVVFAPRGRHSEKPDEVRRRIERLVAGPYLELFARKEVPGWTTWGNEIAPLNDQGPAETAAAELPRAANDVVAVDPEALAVIEQLPRVAGAAKRSTHVTAKPCSLPSRMSGAGGSSAPLTQ